MATYGVRWDGNSWQAVLRNLVVNGHQAWGGAHSPFRLLALRWRGHRGDVWRSGKLRAEESIQACGSVCFSPRRRGEYGSLVAWLGVFIVRGSPGTGGEVFGAFQRGHLTVRLPREPGPRARGRGE